MSPISWTSPRTWIAGETVTAALLNTHLRDNLKAIGDPWTAYAPSWSAATTAPTLGNGTLTGQYVIAGKFVAWRLRLVFGSTTTVGAGTYSFSLPAAGDSSGYDVAGSGLARDDSTTSYMPLTARLVGTTVDLITGTGARVNAAAPFAWAVADSIAVAGVYEAV